MHRALPSRAVVINGAGFGISIDPNDHVWVGNFGFEESACLNHPRANSVSTFDLNGVPLSPSNGYKGGDTIKSPQRTQSDYGGNIWIANYATDPGVITEFVKGDPNQIKTFSNLGLSKPFDIAVDAHGSLWVTSTNNDKVVEFDGTGSPVASYSGAFNNPLAVAIDSLGNAWVTNLRGSSITEIDTQGATHVFRDGALQGPWGIAIDGNDNVWAADNWKQIPIPTNPGGSGMLELIGIAAPVKAPRIGPPQ